MIEEKLKNIFRTLFPSLEGVADDRVVSASMRVTEDWDSMGHLNLLAVLEEEFGVKIGDEVALQINSYAKVEEFLSDKGVIT